MKYLAWCVLALGAFEIISNLYHLSKGSVENIGRSAKRQHQELPLSLDDVHFFFKAVIMFVFGLLLLAGGVLSLIDHSGYSTITRGILALFGAYGLVQAFVYRQYLNVWPAAAVYNIPLALYLSLQAM